MKNKTVIAVLICLSFLKLEAQLKVFNDGNVAVGSVNYTGHNFFSYGNESVFEFAGTNLYVKPNYQGHAQIGNSRNAIEFVHPFVGWNTIYRGACVHVSDQKLKKNISDIQQSSSLQLILGLKPKKYQFLDSIIPGGGYEFGFLAQDIAPTLPELIDTTSQGYLTVNYEQLIPLLTGAIKEQNSTIDSLKQQIATIQSTCCTQVNRTIITPLANDSLLKELNQIKQELNYLKENCCRSSISEPQTNPDFLSQNIPNPFDGTTTIPFVLINKYRDSYIKIYNLNGEEIKSFHINNEDKQLVVNLQELKSGMYLYSLICDSKLIDSKKMILSK